nr:copia protein [Tanacetum cinerariifolium]
MQEELNQFIDNDAWELVLQPRNMTIIGTKWVFRNKLDGNGVVSRNKARLVAQGYNQQEGIDYDETYAPVARLESIRILLAYAYGLEFKLFQMDVKSAFLNGFINEEVYVAQSPRFIDFEKPDHVYKLKKALYRLKQAAKAWPDIMFSVCLCACFQEAPETSHIEAIKRIFRYIKGTTHLGLWYPKGTDIETIVYANSDHAGDYVDRKSTSGICTFVGCCLTSWFSKKQTALAISTIEAEYVSAGKACQQALWMKQALIDYDVRLDDVPIMDHVLACLCYMLYYVVHSEKFNLAYYMAKRIEWVTKQSRLILPYGMILTRLFKFIINENPKLYKESYVLYDRVMTPLAAQLERKPRKDHGTRRDRHSTSSSTFNQPSSSHLNDDGDGINEGTSRASTPSLIRYVNSLTIEVPQVLQNPPNIDPHLEPFYTRQTEIINCQVQIRDEHRGGLRSIEKGLRNL